MSGLVAPSRRRLRILLTTMVGVVATFLLVALISEFRPVTQLPAPTASPSPTARSAMGLSPVGIEMSANADCAACHLTEAGTVGTKTIPLLAHPLDGWRDCTACHADDRLVKTAPGHSGLHKADCLVCHKPPAPGASAAPRPHHIYEGKTCVSCHGTRAPLPTDMAGRTNCWICHSGTEYEDLFAGGSAPPTAAPPTAAP